MSNRGYFMSIQFCNSEIHLTYQQYLVVKLNEITFDNNKFLLQLQLQNFEYKIYQLLLWSTLDSCVEIFNWVGPWNCTKMHYKRFLTNLQKKSQIMKLYFRPPYISLLRYTRHFQSETFVMTLRLPLSYMYFSFPNTDLTSHKEI